MSEKLDCPFDPVVEGMAPGPETAPPAKKRGGGPRTEAGRLSSRRNAMRHGMTARVLLPDDLVMVVAARTVELTALFAPASAYEGWLVGEMARATARLDRCAELTMVDLGRTIDRAGLCWEADRRKAADDLGSRLSKDPERVSRALSRSRQGADWSIERWEGLGAALRTNGGWDDAQRQLAYDLLGVAPALRNGSDRVPPPGGAEGLARLVGGGIGRPREAKPLALDAPDEAEQAMTAIGMPLEEAACPARLRRYEAAARRSFLASFNELQRLRDGS